ncbi:MAG: non-heme iron oxygenase ferredoxin subunit [Chloroflexi bacterium]|nr:non-heme iron oxygenase ferredoxin subunit [Chloroflexota bacterium]
MGEFITAAKISDLAVGRVKSCRLGNKRIALCNVDGEFFAIEDECTHDKGPLDQGELEDDEIECPRHGARFNVRTGAVTSMPAVVPVGTYKVRIKGDEVQVEV